MNNQETARLLFPLIRAALFSEEVPKDVVDALDEEAVQSVYKLSKFHDLAHIAGNVLSDLELLHGEGEKHFGKYQYLAIYRYQRIVHELSVLRAFFEAEKVAFMPLKGTVLRDYYPDPSMRTSCDIDILVHQEDLESVCAALEEKLHYKLDHSDTHDVSFFAPSDLHIEIHFSLYGREDPRTPLLGDVWENSRLKEGSQYEYEMSHEFFYAYFISHTAKHFYIGGCGIRPFLDIAVMQKFMPYDKEKLNRLLAKAGLEQFNLYVDKLSAYWLLGGEADETVAVMEEFILEGGTYGSIESYVSSVYKTNNWFVYFMRRLFPPYRDLKQNYPILHKAPILLPAIVVIRWCSFLFTKRRKNVARHLRAVKRGDSDKNERFANMQKTLHLE